MPAAPINVTVAPDTPSVPVTIGVTDIGTAGSTP
jgi:hypothetical protein